MIRFRRTKEPQIEYSGQISMLRAFSSVLAGAGAFLSVLHVAIGYLNFEEEVDEETGEVSKFLDEEQYKYYLLIAGLLVFACAMSVLFRRFPAVAVVASVLPATYCMILFDQNKLPEWEFALSTAVKNEAALTLLLLSVAAFAGYSAVALWYDRQAGKDTYRYALILIGGVIAVFAMCVFFRAEGAYEQVKDMTSSDAAYEGKEALRNYKRLKALGKVFENQHTLTYFRLSVMQLIAVSFAFFWPKRRFLIRAVSCVPVVYLLKTVAAEELDFLPMLYAVPMLAFFFGCQAWCSSAARTAAGTGMSAVETASPSEEDRSHETPSGAKPESSSASEASGAPEGREET